ncbi:N-acetylneuraminate synthase family protein [Spirochaeta cellobiosiphila]|uniref:N-acetylneuraminate synthase family protein n=1 Tax=Spirochaeta cellobiosiphila TaxID=504483 RepID=UPI00040C4D58|nr:N-acetylneuraminate synthase family protein [Spirochaeta cellobiosiphila]
MNDKTTIIAEIGTSHNGSLQRAKELILRAKESGADWAKFQIVIAEEIIHPRTGLVSLPGGQTSLFDRFKALERPLDFYQEIKDFCESQHIGFFASPFGIQSARMLKQLKVELIKIASPEVNHYPLLEEISHYKTPVILSTGVSRISDIEEALDILPQNTSLLHCITQYPSPEEEYNLLAIPAMARIFGRKVGLSDHSLHPELVPGIAVSLGASIIEKHFTLSHADGGLDDPIALEPKEFSQMVNIIGQAENDPEKTMKTLMDKYGATKIQKIMGDGQKELAPSEKDNYRTTNRSILVTQDILAGTILDDSNTALLRSEKQLKPGLHPRYWKIIKGAKIHRNLTSGHGLEWKDILDYS